MQPEIRDYIQEQSAEGFKIVETLCAVKTSLVTISRGSALRWRLLGLGNKLYMCTKVPKSLVCRFSYGNCGTAQCPYRRFVRGTYLGT